MKITCLGGGSIYFVRAIPDLLRSPDLAGGELVLYDIDTDKVSRVAARAQRLAVESRSGSRVRVARDLGDALDGADFALASIGGSGADVSRRVYESRYHNADVVIPAKYGIQQVIGDTCGPAGLMMGLRTVPVYLHICREIEQRCPDVVLLNHANPMAVLCRAMRKYSRVNAIGICHGVQEGIVHAAGLLNVPPGEIECRWIGTNHYYWFTQVRHRGQDVYPELRRRAAQQPPQPGTELSTRLSQIYGYQLVYPPDDHVVEFYPFLAQCRNGLASLSPTLQESARQHGHADHMPLPDNQPVAPQVRREFLQAYEAMLDDMTMTTDAENSILREGVGALLSAIATGRREVAIVNIPNDGAIDNLPANALVEIEAVTDSTGVRGVSMGHAPIALKGILEKRFAWQELVVDAAAQGDRNLALQALLLDEMAIRPEPAEAMLDELLEASRNLLPAFFGADS